MQIPFRTLSTVLALSAAGSLVAPASAQSVIRNGRWVTPGTTNSVPQKRRPSTQAATAPTLPTAHVGTPPVFTSAPVSDRTDALPHSVAMPPSDARQEPALASATDREVVRTPPPAPVTSAGMTPVAAASDGGYERPEVGDRLPSRFLQPRYAVSDWSAFGLQRPPAGMSWVRYYDDAVLVDGRGRVADSMGGIDWDAPERGPTAPFQADENGYGASYPMPSRDDAFDAGRRQVDRSAYPPAPPSNGTVEPVPMRRLSCPTSCAASGTTSVTTSTPGYVRDGYYYPPTTTTVVTIPGPVITREVTTHHVVTRYRKGYATKLVRRRPVSHGKLLSRRTKRLRRR